MKVHNAVPVTPRSAEQPPGSTPLHIETDFDVQRVDSWKEEVITRQTWEYDGGYTRDSSGKWEYDHDKYERLKTESG